MNGVYWVGGGKLGGGGEVGEVPAAWLVWLGDVDGEMRGGAEMGGWVK